MLLTIPKIKSLEYRFKIRSISPYLQHKMNDQDLQEWLEHRGHIIENKRQNIPHEIMADFHSYIDEDGKYYFPTKHLKQSLVGAGRLTKGKVGNSTRSLTNVVAGMWRIKPERIYIGHWDSIMIESAINHSVKARVLPIRPQWDCLEFEFFLTVMNDTMTDKTVVKIVQDSGLFQGIGNYRPEHKGEFGMFEIVEAERLTTKAKGRPKKTAA